MKATWRRPETLQIVKLAEDLKQAADELAKTTLERADRLMEMKRMIKDKGRIAKWKQERDGK